MCPDDWKSQAQQHGLDSHHDLICPQGAIELTEASASAYVAVREK